MEPLTVRLESLDVWVSFKLSDETLFLPQSCILTVNVTVEPVLAVTGEAGETSEYQKLATPEPVVQLGFPELLPVLVNVMLGLLVVNISYRKITGGILNGKGVGCRILRTNGKTYVAVLGLDINRRRGTVDCSS